MLQFPLKPGLAKYFYIYAGTPPFFVICTILSKVPFSFRRPSEVPRSPLMYPGQGK